MSQIAITECANCETKFVQRKWICPNCRSIEFKTRKIAGDGTVFSHTTIHITSKEFAYLTPYTVALIDLEEGIRLTGRVTEPVEINDQVSFSGLEEQAYIFSKVTEK
ncbi:MULTISPECIES: Zn-ribbon domain-containing OB-fold protein [Bacillus]|uniref:Zn-ribbon domain-containing OB-fold protein n=1 Tax=Bacillus TaxID=1386 RepID=UPI00273D42C6|nr:OB-fold domain-containing protein [Bacillus sp. MMSF_3328]